MSSRRLISGFCASLAVGIALSFVSPLWANPANVLNWNQLPTEQTLKSDIGNQKLNTVRFETFGAAAPEMRIVGYFLYKDGIEVRTAGPNFETVGKMSLNDVFADYDKIIRARFYRTASMPVIREVVRDGAVVGYTASDLNMGVSLWDVTSEKASSAISLDLRYQDLRSQKSGRMGSGPK
jgi:hypothetical protein